MPSPRLTDEKIKATIAAWHQHDKDKEATAKALGNSRRTVDDHLAEGSKRGFNLSEPPAMPGFVITEVTSTERHDKEGNVSTAQTIRQKIDPGAQPDFVIPGTHFMGKTTVHVKDGKVVQEWPRLMPDQEAREAAFRAMVDGLRETLPRFVPSKPALLTSTRPNLLNQYTVTDLHFGMLAWKAENRKRDWDLKIAEQLLLDWFSAAIETSPHAAMALLAQLGDIMHHDSLRSVTPAHGHVLDADSRLQKVIRVVIRVIRQIIGMLLAKYPHVHIVMASGNHDEASSIWLREMLSTMYENEPRVTVDNSADLYYQYGWGETALFYHHGHKRNIKNGVDAVFASKFREMYGRCRKAYGHVGHFHDDEAKDTPLMKVERHRTLASPDAHANGGGWLSEQDAKVITYHKNFGEVGRHTLTPEMVMEFAA